MDITHAENINQITMYLKPPKQIYKLNSTYFIEVYHIPEYDIIWTGIAKPINVLDYELDITVRSGCKTIFVWLIRLKS